MFKEIVPRRKNDSMSPVFSMTEDLDVYVSGGYARWCCSPLKQPAPYGDIDLWFGDGDTYMEFLKRFFEEFSEYEVLEDNMIVRIRWNGIELNFVSPFIECGSMSVVSGSVKDIIGSFDFSICQAALLDENRALVSEDFLYDEKNLILRIKNLRPLKYWRGILKRVRKYMKRGYTL